MDRIATEYLTPCFYKVYVLWNTEDSIHPKLQFLKLPNKNCSDKTCKGSYFVDSDQLIDSDKVQSSRVLPLLQTHNSQGDLVD